MKALGFFLGAITGAIGMLLALGLRRNGACAYPARRPVTPAASGWPDGPGFRGEWAASPDVAVTLSTYRFVWRSFFLRPDRFQDFGPAQHRVIVFRLEGNPLVHLVSVSGGGAVALDGRSAYSCCDENGEITVEVHIQAGAANEGTAGRLWGIDGMVERGRGVLALFEIGVP